MSLCFALIVISLPVTFKFGDNDNPVYYKFTTLEELTDFINK